VSDHPPSRITVVTGPEAVLLDREVADLTARLERNGPGLDVVTIDCSSKSNADDPTVSSNSEKIFQALSPSLFGEPPIVVVRSLEASDESTQSVLKEAVAQQEGSPIVIGHSGAARGRAVINAAKRNGAQVIKCQRPNERDVRNLMRLEARQYGGNVSPQAEQWLIDSIGIDSLALLLGAVRQSVVDCGGGRVNEEDVHAVFPMQAKVSAFKIVDNLWAGNLDEATRLLRGMEHREKGAGVAVLAAIAHGLRMMALFGRPGSRPPAGMNVAPWQIERARTNAKRWGASGARIATVSARLPMLDADMKGGLEGGVALDDEQKMAVLEALVVRLAQAPQR
jgi:DNA polymerase-3 subunit delta